MNIEQLCKNLGLEKDEYRELLDLFIQTGMTDLDKLEAAVRDQNAENAMQAAHSIKGAAGNLGLLEFYDMLKKVEENARNGILEGAVESTQVLKKKMAEIDRLAHE